MKKRNEDEIHEREERRCTEAERIRCFTEVCDRLGYRKERYGTWIPDVTFVSRSKLRYRCSFCGYWQVAKAQNAESLLRSLRYCNGCGAKILEIETEEKKQ